MLVKQPDPNISVSIIIEGNDRLNFEEIERELLITPYRKMVKNGKVKYSNGNECSFLSNDNDLIIYNVVQNDYLNYEDAIKGKLCEFLQFKEYLHMLQKNVSMVFRLVITSDFAQINYQLSSDIIKLISDLQLEFEVSILSFGNVIDI